MVWDQMLLEQGIPGFLKNKKSGINMITSVVGDGYVTAELRTWKLTCLGA